LDAIKDDLHLAAVKGLLAAHACELSRVFARAFEDMLRGKTRSVRDVSRALKAQNQCRIALRLLVTLSQAEQRAKKSRNRTNKLLEDENRHHDQDVGCPLAESHSRPDEARTQELAEAACPPKPDLSSEALAKEDERRRNPGLDPGEPGPAAPERSEGGLVSLQPEDAKEHNVDPGTPVANPEGKYLQLHFTVEDPKFFTTKWSATVTYRYANTGQVGDWAEQACAENLFWYPGVESDVPRALKPDF
jgi:hypothetical protein